MTDPIRASLDYCEKARHASTLADALRAVLDLSYQMDAGGYLSCAETALIIRRVIAEHLGVTDA